MVFVKHGTVKKNASEYLRDDIAQFKRKAKKFIAGGAAVLAAGIGAYFGGTTLYNRYIESQNNYAIAQAASAKENLKGAEIKRKLKQEQIAKERYARQVRLLEQEKKKMILQYAHSELKNSYDTEKIARNIFDCVIMPADEDYSYFKGDVKPTEEIQISPENKALAVAVEALYDKVVDKGIMSAKDMNKIMEDGGFIEYEYDEGEVVLKVKTGQDEGVYQDILTLKDKKDRKIIEALEKIVENGHGK